MKQQHRVGIAALLLGATAAGMAGCFSSYQGDCNRDPDLDCFWGAGAAGGAGGTGGAGAGGAVTTTSAHECGDHVQDPGEACDDGNTKDCDGCRGDCSAKETGCGDGFTCGVEECDEGDQNADTGACTTMCTQAACGDGFQQAGEECDDGGSAPGDNCSADCKVECAIGNLPFGGNPQNYTVYLDPVEMHCYVHVAKPQKTWSGAHTACTDWGGDLFAFEKQSEVTAVTGALTTLTAPSWTGGSDGTVDGVFGWSNGEAWPDVSPWAAGEPNLVGPGCAGIDTSKKLSDYPCGQVLAGGYICELDLATLP